MRVTGGGGLPSNAVKAKDYRGAHCIGVVELRGGEKGQGFVCPCFSLRAGTCGLKRRPLMLSRS